MPAAKPKSFRATLEYLASPALGWVVARIPFDVKKTWGHSRVKVRGEVHGIAFRTTLFPAREGGHFLLVNKKVQKGAQIFPGVTAEFRLAPDTAPRETSTPPELEAIFRHSKKLKHWFEALSYSYRKYINDWISEPKGISSRKRRAEQLAERILETMEAEHELPPLIKSALAQNGKAARGWNLMTPTQRRSELMGIFYYRTPDARARRLEKTLHAAAAVADRKEKD
jgi:uncharacterized protein YdeI (YjbR/CyaY-like superfamily)